MDARKTVAVSIVAAIIVMCSAIMISEGKPLRGVLLVLLIGGSCAALGLWIGFAAAGNSDTMATPALPWQNLARARNSAIGCFILAALVAIGSFRNAFSGDPSRLRLGVGQALLFIPLFLYFGVRNLRKAQAPPS